MWFPHDNTPSNLKYLVCRDLDNVFEKNWICRGNSASQVPWSPDLNPLVFYYWGVTKSTMYTNEIIDFDDYRSRFEATAKIIRGKTTFYIQRHGDSFVQLMQKVESTKKF